MVVGFCLLALAAVDVSNKLPPNNIRHKFAPNPTGARAVVVVVGLVLGLAVMTTGFLVVIVGTVLDCIDAVVLASVDFFVLDVLPALNCQFGDDVDECGDKSITIGLEDGLGDKRFLIALESVFKFEA